VKVVALGGSAAGPNTGAGCAGFLITEGDTSVVIDLGPGTLLELRNHVDYRALSAIVISHYHLDHILDLAALRFLAKYNPVPMDGKIPLWVPPGSGDRFAQWGTVFGDPSEGDFLEAVFDVNEYDPVQSLPIGVLSISFARTVHPVPAWAMRVSRTDGGDFGYTADTGPAALPDLVEFFWDIALLTSEATEPPEPTPWNGSRGHLTPAEAGRLATGAGAKTLMLTHRWEELGLDRGAAEAQTAFAGPVMIAQPGLTVFI
jgi:ribonuclease BN (tRNA processing enzyme)